MNAKLIGIGKKGFAVLAFAVLVGAAAFGAEGPTRDYLSDATFVAEFRRAALDCARRKSQELKPPRLATGGTFTGYFIWDTAFCCRWAALTKPGEFPAASSLDCLYSFAEKDGYICREYTADGEPMISADHPISFGPPILSRAELLLYRAGHTDLQRLKRVYVPLQAPSCRNPAPLAASRRTLFLHAVRLRNGRPAALAARDVP